MPSIPTLHADDPVSRLIDRSTRISGKFPVPLIATSYDITIAGGLACVTARRVFRNQEATNIEATLTFPVAVHAVLFGLEARIGERTLKAVAKDKSAARETYEDALDRGRTAVLHEELLKGIHMLSVAHVAPGTEIEVTVRYAQPLTWIGGRAMLRIPTTVGDIYGTSGLPDSDDLMHGGPVTAADLKVACEVGTSARVNGVEFAPGMRVPLDRPIRLEVAGWVPRAIAGATAAGERLSLDISPAGEGDAPLDVAILIDRSASMGETCATGAGLTKHAAVLLGLAEAVRGLKETDRINLWEFDTTVEDLGTARGSRANDLICMLSGLGGGTEIGGAINAVLARRPVRDVVLVTDGKSHALDVQRLAAQGVRFSVVLIGEDSLEANVGHLAALTGGEILAADGVDVGAALKGVIGALRVASPAATETAGAACLVRALRGGMEIAAKRMADGDAAETEADAAVRAAGAYAASLRLATLSSVEAAQLAVTEGLVTHLTSLVLVDEEGEAQAGLPATRKVALASPATFAAAMGDHVRMYMRDVPEPMHALCARLARDDEPRQCRLPEFSRPAHRSSPGVSRAHRETAAEPAAPASKDSQAPKLTHLPRRIDWRNEGQRLVEGNLIGLPHDVADAIDEAARVGVVKRTAKKLGVSARVLVIGLLARVVAGRDRHAERVYRAILARAKTRDIVHAAERLGLTNAAARV